MGLTARRKALILKARRSPRSGRVSPLHGQVLVEGLDDLARAFSLAPPQIKVELQTELREGVLLARARAVQIAPRGRAGDKRAGHPGLLAASLKVIRRRLGFALGGTLDYLGVVLFGKIAEHPGHGHRDDHVRRLTPNPFLLEAIRDTAPRIIARVGPAIDRALARLFD
jgi:hypothetical protein